MTQAAQIVEFVLTHWNMKIRESESDGYNDNKHLLRLSVSMIVCTPSYTYNALNALLNRTNCFIS